MRRLPPRALPSAERIAPAADDTVAPYAELALLEAQHALGMVMGRIAPRAKDRHSGREVAARAVAEAAWTHFLAGEPRLLH